MEAGTARRGRADRRGGQADPDRVRPLLDRAAGTRQPARRARTGLQADLLREDQHPRQGPELEKALKLAYDIKEAAPDQEVILTVHELNRLARNAAELMTLSAQLQTAGVQLKLLTGPLTGIYDPNGMGAMFFAVLAAAAQIDRNYTREKTLEGQVTAAAKGNHGARR